LEVITKSLLLLLFFIFNNSALKSIKIIHYLYPNHEEKSYMLKIRRYDNQFISVA